MVETEEQTSNGNSKTEHHNLNRETQAKQHSHQEENYLNGKEQTWEERKETKLASLASFSCSSYP